MMASSAIVWLSFVGIAMVFDRPVYALLPLFIIIIDYLGKADKRFQKIPSGLVAIVLGAAIAWGTGYLTPDNFTSAFSNLGFYPPTFCGIDIARVLVGFSRFCRLLFHCRSIIFFLRFRVWNLLNLLVIFIRKRDL